MPPKTHKIFYGTHVTCTWDGLIVKCLLDEEGDRIESTAHLALHQIHLDLDSTNWDQLSLFNEMNLAVEYL